MFTWSHSRKKRDGKEESFFFLKNGSAVLEQLIRCFNGDCNLIRSYSAEELNKATSDFRWKIHHDENYSVYKGIHQHREILVKKVMSNKDDNDELERIANEVAIASRMSSQKNVLKLLGCCLETELPLLVFEFPAMGNLESVIYNRKRQQQLPWEHKLRIASEIANAIAYLHYGLSKMTIHRNIHPSSIFLDQNYIAKLFNFQDALQIPEGEAHVDAEVVGTFRFVAPEIAEKGRYVERSDSDLSTFLVDEPKFDRVTSSDGRYTEKSDVYGFGVLLLEILTGKRSNTYFFRHSELISYKRISSFCLLKSCQSSADTLREQFDICSKEGENKEPEWSSVKSEEIKQVYGDSYKQEENGVPINSNFQIEEFYASIFKEYSESNHSQEENGSQIMEYVKLVQRCLKVNPDDRPDMIEVGKALRFIKNIKH